MTSRNSGKTTYQDRSESLTGLWPHNEFQDDSVLGKTSSKPTSIDRNSLIVSGSKGKLGKILQKMHRGEVLSQHEISAAIRDFNQMNSTILDLERKTKNLKLQVAPEDSLNSVGPGSKSRKQKEDPDKELKDKLARKDRLIAELTKKLEGQNHMIRSKAPKRVAVADIAPPSRVVDGFCDLFQGEWSLAYELLKRIWKDEERAAFTLLRVVRHAYVFCFDMAEAQRDTVEDANGQLQEAMLHPVFIHPVSKLKYKPSTEVDVETQKCIEIGTQMIKEYRNIFISRSITGMQELFRKVKLPEILETPMVSKAVRDYVDRVVELVWLMVVQDPPMYVYWLEPKRTCLPEYFNFFEDKGTFVKQTVWPAVFLRENGPIMSKGVVMAAEDEEDVTP